MPRSMQLWASSGPPRRLAASVGTRCSAPVPSARAMTAPALHAEEVKFHRAEEV